MTIPLAIVAPGLQEEPVIDDDYDGPDFTCITFSPDWKRFHMTGMEADTIALLRKVDSCTVVVATLQRRLSNAG